MALEPRPRRVTRAAEWSAGSSPGVPVAGLLDLFLAWASLSPSPCPPVSGPNGLAQDRTTEAPGLQFRLPNPSPSSLGVRDVCLGMGPRALSCPLPRTHPPLNSLHNPRHKACTHLQETHPPQPLCLHSLPCPFLGLALCPRLSQPRTQSYPRPPSAGDAPIKAGT